MPSYQMRLDQMIRIIMIWDEMGSYQIQSHLIWWHIILSYLILSYLILSYLKPFDMISYEICLIRSSIRSIFRLSSVVWGCACLCLHSCLIIMLRRNCESIYRTSFKGGYRGPECRERSQPEGTGSHTTGMKKYKNRLE